MNYQQLVEKALAEDVGRGDVTTNSIIPADLSGTARIYAKQALVVCGHEIAQPACHSSIQGLLWSHLNLRNKYNLP